MFLGGKFLNQVLFHQGKRDSIQVILIEERALLAVIFDQRTQLGLVRLMSNEAAKKLTEIFIKAESRAKDPEEEFEMGEGFEQSAKDLLDNLFGEE